MDLKVKIKNLIYFTSICYNFRFNEFACSYFAALQKVKMAIYGSTLTIQNRFVYFSIPFGHFMAGRLKFLELM